MDVSGVLLDIDGVLVTSWRPLAGAVAAVRDLRETGLPVRFVTNTTSRSAGEIADLLRDAGVDLEDGELITAGVATAELLRSRFAGARCLVLNDGSRADFGGVDLVGPQELDDPGTVEVVVIGSGGPSFGWESLNTALRALESGASLVATHGSLTWVTDEGSCLDGGAFVRVLAEAAGVEPITVGKPAPELFLAGLRSMGVEPGRAVMVGDDVASDVLAAMDVGLFGVLVRTGKYREGAVEAAGRSPDAVIDSVADLPGLLAG